jgi:formate--tetrahydrofolate ligase
MTPDASVLTATVRALKMHGNGPKVTPGVPLPEEYTKENLKLLEAGLCNMIHHIGIVKKAGVTPVVCINKFHTDTKAELEMVKKAAEAAGARAAISEQWARGGEGAIELAEAVIEACNEKSNFQYLYPLEMKLRDRVEKIAKEVYGAGVVSWAPEAAAKAKAFEADPKFADYATLMVKTHLSLSHDPNLKGVPKGFTLPIRDILVFSGAKFLCPLAGSIMLMPGTGSNPGFRRIDVDTKTGEVMGLF